MSSLKWFKSYLVERKQNVINNGITGDGMLITCGVPQGSVFGLTLFIHYVNNICDLATDGQIVTYANDACFIFFLGRSANINYTGIYKCNRIPKL